MINTIISSTVNQIVRRNINSNAIIVISLFWTHNWDNFYFQNDCTMYSIYLQDIDILLLLLTNVNGHLILCNVTFKSIRKFSNAGEEIDRQFWGLHQSVS